MANSLFQKFFLKAQAIRWILIVLFQAIPFSASAQTNLDCYRMDAKCRGQGGYKSPSNSGKVKINPSAVPVDKGIGLEGIFFKGQVDVSLVSGTGRVGAAISPSNSEETFFGPPGFELPEDFLIRKKDFQKYPQQKVTLATAFSIAEKKGNGLKGYSLNAGVMGKYNQLTKNASPGAGITGTLGPFTFGSSLYNDETQLNYEIYGSDQKPTVSYQVQTYNLGIFLNAVIVDYSRLHLRTTDTSTVNLLTFTLMYKNFIFTGSKRTEDSSRPIYNYQTKQLEVQQVKDEVFGGIQYSANKNILIGVLYNYYLLRELSATATLFF